MNKPHHFPDAEIILPERMTPEQFVNWVASWVMDGDLIDPAKDFDRFFVDPDDEAYEYEMENDEVYANYAAIVTEARRLRDETSSE